MLVWAFLIWTNLYKTRYIYKNLKTNVGYLLYFFMLCMVDELLKNEKSAGSGEIGSVLSVFNYRADVSIKNKI